MKRFFTKLFFIEILLYRIVVYFVRLFWGGRGEVAGRVKFFDFADIQKCKTFSDKIDCFKRRQFRYFDPQHF